MARTEAPAPAVDPAFVNDFFPRWGAAWDSHDPEQLLALMTDDIIYDDAAWPRTMHGHADVREFLHHAWTGFPDLRFEVRQGPFVHPTEPEATAGWEGFATHTGTIDPPGVAPTGRRLRFKGFDWHVYRDGKVARLWICFDMAGVMRDLGVLPAAGSRAELVTAKLANLQTKLRRSPA
jgi:steroid delta-isomerase-like uncharacterized protein